MEDDVKPVVLVGRAGRFEDLNLRRQEGFDSVDDLKRITVTRSNVDDSKVTKIYWPVHMKDTTGRDIFVEGEIDGE